MVIESRCCRQGYSLGSQSAYLFWKVPNQAANLALLSVACSGTLILSVKRSGEIQNLSLVIDVNAYVHASALLLLNDDHCTSIKCQLKTVLAYDSLRVSCMTLVALQGSQSSITSARIPESVT